MINFSPQTNRRHLSSHLETIFELLRQIFRISASTPLLPYLYFHQAPNLSISHTPLNTASQAHAGC